MTKTKRNRALTDKVLAQEKMKKREKGSKRAIEREREREVKMGSVE